MLSNTGTFKTYNNGTYADATAEKTDTYAKVYFKASQGSQCGIKYYNYTPTKLTMTLSNAGFAETATLTFSGDTTDQLFALPETIGDNSTTTSGSNSFVWSNGATQCWRWVGYYKNSDGGDTKRAAGKLTANVLSLTLGDEVYTVRLSQSITIENPY